MYFCVLIAHFFLALSNIPSFGCTAVYLFMLLLGLELLFGKVMSFDLIYLVTISLVGVSISSCWVLANRAFPGIGPFHLGY